jgi:proteasome lid subunit RPN8/RPN11/LysM repeat protein
LNNNGNNDSENELDINLKETITRNNNVELERSKVFIEVNEASSRFILDYSVSDTSQELGGILLGNYSKKEEHYQVSVEAAVKALYTEAKKGSVTFTHKTWEHINKVREEQYPDYKVVGWFHTHPGFGIFLSGYDKFIHKNFFNLPWQIAYVVDPIAGQHGFFGWSNDSIVKLPFKALVAPYRREEKIVPVETEEKKVSSFGKIAVASAMAILLLTNGMLLFLNNRSSKDQDELEIKQMALESNIDSKQSEIDHLKLIIEDLQASRVDEDLEDIYYSYIVEQGDTLWSISEKLFGEGNLYTELIQYNQIDDPDKIYPGDRLFFPLSLMQR